ncbi:MAG TPA: glycosyltransferase family 2 protein [Candidatus Omnitrophota bacterium]|mgnify:CR=1 FL=1|nr:glycosyltransferase family 2 protein [Candidatus Omnitrophota bacterium]HQL40932.1 glycosyltransferase family 2 protein [Candidatus Omnitrophota bacterium]
MKQHPANLISQRSTQEAFKVFEVFAVMVVGATSFFYLVSILWPGSLSISYHIVVSFLLFQAALSYWYTLSVFNPKRFVALPSAEHKEIPRTTFIVTAYLPNEIAVIEESLMNILQNIERPQDGVEVILAYNTPHMEPLELALRDLALRWPQLILANAYNSRSKSENLNYAINIASGKMIALLDADHLVAPDCLRRAWRWLDEGYDVVQGRCRVRNIHDSFVSRLVGVEFEIIYGIQHPSKSIIFDTSLFGGSNGYWKSTALKSVRFLESMLTEDIDSTLRGVLSGCRFVHDRSIVSSELAPVTWSGFWAQRKRWAQGWFQCSVRYQGRIWATRYLNLRQKFIWTTLLSWRVLYDIVGSLLFPILFAFWLYRGTVAFPMNHYIAFALVFTLFSGPLQAIAACKNASRPRAPLTHYLFYFIFVWPYTIYKIIIHLVAIRDELTGERIWVVSKRKAR